MYSIKQATFNGVMDGDFPAVLAAGKNGYMSATFKIRLFGKRIQEFSILYRK
jgi:hypothetical protein